MTSNDFSKYYQTVSNTELLSILDNPNQYQFLAIEAAQKELLRRQLSETEINDAKETLIESQSQKEKRKVQIKTIENNLKNTRLTIIDNLNPIQTGQTSAEKNIRIIVLIFGALFLYQFVINIRNLLSYLKDFPRFPFQSALFLFPFIFIPIVTFTFWKRKKIGWILLTIFLTYAFVCAFLLLITSFNRNNNYNDSMIDNLFPRQPITTYLFQLLFLIGTLYVICKKSIRDIYLISKQTMTLTIGLTGLLTFIVMT